MRDLHLYSAVTSAGHNNNPVVIVRSFGRKMLFFTRPGRDSTWIPIQGDDMYRNVTLYRGEFYALKLYGEVDVIKGHDSSSPTASSIISGLQCDVNLDDLDLALVATSSGLLMARNEEKAKRMLGPDVDMIVGDITNESTLIPEYFKGVKKVIKAKEGDTPDILRTAEFTWGALDDVVMGGVSESTFQVDQTGNESAGPTGLFKGVVSTANNGGFTSIKTKNFSVPEDLSAYEGLELQVKGDGRHYKLIVRTSAEWDTVGYTTGFDTVIDQWQTISLPFSSLRPIFRAKTVFDDHPLIQAKLSLCSKFEYDGKLNPTFVEGPFQLPISTIKAYMKESITPRFVLVSSAGVTTPDRPELDLTKQPSAVRLNKELDFILTFKSKVCPMHFVFPSN
ncbi:hypothetical protein IFM89_007597 [Coptis chinensis]|uniref:NADH:ubiquinone oxidoreductase intermediate-associated protein 30 domain-containing protein n=1 Tax=Coptis chinensis TaxID=261450 RepID=A0A835GV53_9MAGN|nr:hypothetical protein IFM89_007597 [Coptis chinensis]